MSRGAWPTTTGEGNVYLTGRGVSAYNPDGKKIMHLPFLDMDSQCDFAGPNDGTVYHRGDSVFVIKTKMQGR